ncbi:hypothetical protein [Stieleria marina]|uniref:hypothetical protein n=1 Tax=Stieleria marina TaxID=1930275 RepID=UPI003AF3897B
MLSLNEGGCIDFVGWLKQKAAASFRQLADGSRYKDHTAAICAAQMGDAVEFN